MSDQKELIDNLTKAIENADAAAAAELFHEDAEYHDCVYGLFKGRENLPDFFKRWFKDGSNYTWRFYDILVSGNKLNAHYYFSYTMSSARLNFPLIEATGMGCFEFNNDLIYRYSEIVNMVIPAIQMKLPEKIFNHRIQQNFKESMLQIQNIKKKLKIQSIF